MRFVNTADGGLIWPEESITGGASNDHTLLDTDWNINWPGPGHVYLHDRDLVDLVVPALEREPVRDALVANGWTAPGETAAKVAELEAKLEATSQELANSKITEAGFDAALKKLQTKPAAARRQMTTNAKE